MRTRATACASTPSVRSTSAPNSSRAIIEKEQRERGVDAATAAADFTRANVLGRLGEPEEVADLTPSSSPPTGAKFVCGTSVSIDGGYHRYVFG